MEEKQYIALSYNIGGVYGEINHMKLIEKKDLDLDIQKYVETYRIPTHTSISDVHFCLEIIDCNTNIIGVATDLIQGLPSYIGIDMGTYFKMAQLREIGDIGKNIYVPNNDKQFFKEALGNLADTIILQTKESIRNN